jgi:hypothetical protein
MKLSAYIYSVFVSFAYSFLMYTFPVNVGNVYISVYLIPLSRIVPAVMDMIKTQIFNKNIQP